MKNPRPRGASRRCTTRFGNKLAYHVWSEKSISVRLLVKEIEPAASVQRARKGQARGAFTPVRSGVASGYSPPIVKAADLHLLSIFPRRCMAVQCDRGRRGGRHTGHGAPRRRPLRAEEVTGRGRVVPRRTDGWVNVPGTAEAGPWDDDSGVPSTVGGEAEARPLREDERTGDDGRTRRSGTRCQVPRIPDRLPAEAGGRYGVAMPGCG